MRLDEGSTFGVQYDLTEVERSPSVREVERDDHELDQADAQVTTAAAASAVENHLRSSGYPWLD